MNAILKALLETLNHPAEFLEYDGGKTSYFVFNYSDDRGGEYADDAPQSNIYSMQIHFFCPKSFDFTSLITQVRELLFSNGFSYPTVQTMYESVSKINHIVWECEYVRAREV